MRPTSLPLAIASLLLLAPTVYTSPTSNPPHKSDPPHENGTEKPFVLRTMPLGASITFGLKSTDGNGYREWLRKQMRFAGWEVNMVGSVSSGDMKDNDNEGHSGFVVDEVAQEAEKTIPEAPNLILINAGTNDAVKNVTISEAGKRMNALLDRLYTTIPETTIILSTLLPNGLDGVQPRVDRINAQYREIVRARRHKKQRIVLAEMSEFIKVSELVDKTHPNDGGYKKMAAVWWDAVQTAEKEGLLRAPRECEEKDMGRVLRLGSTGGKDDGVSGVGFARLVKKGDGEKAVDEVVWTRHGEDTLMFVNDGEGKFGKPVKIDVGVEGGCEGGAIHWADFNNDTLDDYICIARDGDMSVSLNRGGNPPKFDSLGKVLTISGNTETKEHVRLGDIDGDGRVDYCLIADTNDIQCWRNGEKDNTWDDLGVVFDHKNHKNNNDDEDFSGARLVNINSGNRTDLLWLDTKGHVSSAYINKHSRSDKDKDSLAPEWRDAGVAYGGVKSDDRDRVLFGRVYPDGRSDYAVVESVESGHGDGWEHFLRVWKNTTPSVPAGETTAVNACPDDDGAAEDDGDVGVDPRLPAYPPKGEDGL